MFSFERCYEFCDITSFFPVTVALHLFQFFIKLGSNDLVFRIFSRDKRVFLTGHTGFKDSRGCYRFCIVWERMLKSYALSAGE